MNNDKKPPISKLILSLMPDATYEEQLEAEYTFNEFLFLAYKLYLRLEAERQGKEKHDKSEGGDTVNGGNPPKQ